MLIDLRRHVDRGALRWVTPRIEPPKSISTATAVTAQIIRRRSPAIFMAAPPLTTYRRSAGAVCHRKLPTSTAKPPMSGRSRMPRKFMRVLAPKRVLTPSVAGYEVNTLHTANGRSAFRDLWFWPRRSWESRLDSGVYFCVTVSPVWVKNPLKPPCSRTEIFRAIRDGFEPQVWRSELRH
ncbi:hypothetical protein KCP69_26195 [Salmonella enterica subsp. enterica]|nr:hypothetical protein KCP69_26195 [Salmonella enterica subsp. enterica]